MKLGVIFAGVQEARFKEDAAWCSGGFAFTSFPGNANGGLGCVLAINLQADVVLGKECTTLNADDVAVLVQDLRLIHCAV